MTRNVPTNVAPNEVATTSATVTRREGVRVVAAPRYRTAYLANGVVNVVNGIRYSVVNRSESSNRPRTPVEQRTRVTQKAVTMVLSRQCTVQEDDIEEVVAWKAVWGPGKIK